MSWVRDVEIEHCVFAFFIIAISLMFVGEIAETIVQGPDNIKLEKRIDELEQRVLELETTETKEN